MRISTTRKKRKQDTCRCDRLPFPHRHTSECAPAAENPPAVGRSIYDKEEWLDRRDRARECNQEM